MKKILLINLIIFNSICFSQNRNNTNLPLISAENKGILLQAKGWLKNQYGEWISRNNKIPNDLSIEYKSLDNFEIYSLGQDNFISYQLKDIEIPNNPYIYQDSTYVVLIKKEKWGYYIYPAINEEWRTSNTCEYYVFKKSELNKFKNIFYDELKIIDINLIYSGYIQPVDLTKFNNLYLSKEINKKIMEQDKYGSNDNERHLYLNLTCIENKNLVQFYFYERTFEEITNKYYETDLATFNKFIKIN